MIDDFPKRPGKGGFGEPTPLQIESVLWCSCKGLKLAVAVTVQEVLDHGAGFEHHKVAFVGVTKHRDFAYGIQRSPLGTAAEFRAEIYRFHGIGKA